MTTLTFRNIDHRREDDSAAFTLLTASFALAIVAILALFVLRIIPTTSMETADSNSVTLSVHDAAQGPRL